jgi:16S rRNA (uracil1498-N3)-methyltransferase
MSTTPRLFVDIMLAQGVPVSLPDAAAHYLVNVMRLRDGDEVHLFDDRSGEWRARLADVGRKRASAVPEELLKPRESVPDLWLCAAPIRKARGDWVAEKACELGVARFVPVVTRRTVVDNPRLDRLRAHMIEAAEQCGRTALPVLSETTTLERLLAGWPAGRALIFADEEGGAPFAQIAGRIAAPAAILIGPEGGFDEAERAVLVAHPQAVRVSLGPRVLRADTAAIAAVALWQAASGDWRAVDDDRPV